VSTTAFDESFPNERTSGCVYTVTAGRSIAIETATTRCETLRCGTLGRGQGFAMFTDPLSAGCG